MNKKKRFYISILVGILVLISIALAVVYRYHSRHIEESPLYLTISSYQENMQESVLHEPTYPQNSSEEIFMRGMIAFASEDYNSAKMLFNQVHPTSDSDPALLAYLYFYSNQCDVKLNGVGNAETVAIALKAIRYYAPLINDTDMLWELVSSISLESGNDSQSIELLQEHLEKADYHMELSTWAWMKNCIAVLYYNNHEYSRSIREFYDVELALENREMTPKLEIEFRYAKEYIANIHFIFEDYENAAAMYRELIDMSMDDETFHAYASCINMASAYLEISDIENAKTAIKILENSMPRVEKDIVSEVEASVNDVYANIYLKTGDYKSAEAYLKQAEAFYEANESNNAFLGGKHFTQLTRCKYLVKTGASSEAQKILEDMIKSGNADYYSLEQEVYELLKDVYNDTEQNEKLILTYQKLLELDSDFSKTIQREYLEFSTFYRENNYLRTHNSRLSRNNSIAILIIVVISAMLIIMVVLIRLLRTKNVTDQLTGALNRKRLTHLIHTYKRIGTPASFGVIMMDIDYFKRYNDTYGHPAGDEILKKVAKTIMGSVRRKDMVIRYGGEEFLVLLKDVQEHTARDICQRIHSQLKEQAIPHASSDVADHVTLSMGLCYQTVSNSAQLETLIKYADECLYESKENGRNRVTTKIM